MGAFDGNQRRRALIRKRVAIPTKKPPKMSNIKGIIENEASGIMPYLLKIVSISTPKLACQVNKSNTANIPIANMPGDANNPRRCGAARISGHGFRRECRANRVLAAVFDGPGPCRGVARTALLSQAPLHPGRIFRSRSSP